MSDLRLRQLAREACACPSAETEAALLRERLRTGDLSLERLELAAYCGHEGARVALGWPDFVLFCDPTDVPRRPGPDMGWKPPKLVRMDGGPRPLLQSGYYNMTMADFVAGLSRWGPGPKEIARRVAVVMCKCSDPGDPVGVCAACLRDTTEPVVRAAIQSALIAWALGEGK